MLAFAMLSFMSLLFGFNSFLFFFILFIPFSFYIFSDHFLTVDCFSLFGLFADETSLFLNFMLIVVIFFSIFFTFTFLGEKSISFFSLTMVFLCSMVFSTSNLLVLYISYEISLIPIIMIISIWGVYPERSLSSMLLLIYTSFFTLPFIYVLWYLYYSSGTMVFMSLYYSSFVSELIFPSYFIMLTFLVFAVKLPIYGLHFWLPMAHVEAPTFGSMILAGVLLKLGGVGLLRCSFMFGNFNFFLSNCISYFIVFLIYVTIVCSLQSDFKRLIAYSSVSHMMVLPIMLFSCTLLGFKGFVLTMVFHGLSSPLLFSIVGYIYSISSTRQLLMIRGVMTYSPLLSLIMVLAFAFTCCIPPFPSFVAEAFFFINSLFMYSFMWIALIVFSLFSLVYNLNWLSSMLFSSSSISVNYCNSFLGFNFFFSSVMLFMVSLVFISFFFMI